MIDQKRAIHKLIATGKPFLLVILDACRYDSFAKVNWLGGKLEKATSQGSTTSEWVQRTFTGWYPDIVYVSGIPYIASRHMLEVHGDFKATGHFFKVIDVWDWGYDWSRMTVMPSAMAKAVAQTAIEYSGKSVIAHFVQPHVPMVGDPPLTIEVWESMVGERMDGRFPTIEDVISKGYYDYLVRAYEGNLKLALTEVQNLIGVWRGKLVITADHGEGFGEEGVFGHSAGIRTPELVEVPFFEVE